MAEVIEHLSIVENRTAQMAKMQIESGRSRGLGPDAGEASVLDSFDAVRAVDRSRHIVTSEANQPTQGLNAEAAWAALLTARDAVRTSVLGGDGLALGDLVVPHSVLGHLNLYHWIAFIGAHELRHAEQIGEIASHLEKLKPVDPAAILGAARAVLLVDWPSADVPRALIEAGLTVFGYSPSRYSTAQIAGDRLVFNPLDAHPAHVDVVCTYRPAAEMSDIVTSLVLPSGARTLWLQPPNTSGEARRLAAEHGLAFIEGVDIAAIARAMPRST